MSNYCYDCGADWSEFGLSWIRVNNKVDYYCKRCKSKRKPVEYLRKEVLIQIIEKALKDKESLYMEEKISSEKDVPKNPKNILVIGDIHEPFCLDGYLEFCVEMRDKHDCDHIIFTGDVIDQHYSSFHITDPDGFSGGDELDYAIEKLQRWKEEFPHADVVMGNHDKIVLRKAFNSGISKRWIKDFNEVLGVDWNFQTSHVINDILFRHGVGQKASPKSGTEFMSVVQGHFHTESYIHFRVGQGKIVFGAQCPCGVDRKAYAMAYAEEFAKPAIGCMVIKEFGRLPIIEMMEM